MAENRKDIEAEILAKISEMSSTIKNATHVDQVISALHSMAVLLFPVDSSLVSGSVDCYYKIQVLKINIPTDAVRDNWRHVFYQGIAFPTLARILIYDVASNWLACFPFSARAQVFYSFFSYGPSTEVVQALVPSLGHNDSCFGCEDVVLSAACSISERILILCLLENNGVHSMAKELSDSPTVEEYTSKRHKPGNLSIVSRMAQLVTSIPDKARLDAPTALSAPIFFNQVAAQLLAAAEERALELYDRKGISDVIIMDGTFSFIGETFARICRRGATDILLLEMMPRILKHVRSCLSSNIDSADLSQMIESNPKSLFWVKIVEAINDSYAVERLSEELLRQLSDAHVNDTEAYWAIWILFHCAFKHQTTVRAMFVDKFLLWKVFPICCLRWILQFAVFQCPPCNGTHAEGRINKGQLDVVRRLVGTWSKREFIQSSSMDQQAYITAAVGLSVEKMSKEDLESTDDLLHSLLQGVGCRLESPIHLVRKMASAIALVFSKVVDPKNPLYLDDSCSDETVDWEYWFTAKKKETLITTHDREIVKDGSKASCSVLDKKVNIGKKLSQLSVVDPDEIIDPASLNNKHSSDDDDDDESKDSENFSDSSLQPYDMSDDDTDLKRKITQLGDLVSALRKSDDPDGVERALDVAESLVRALPDELEHVSADLVRALVHVRCFDVALEGEEDSAEEKRQKSLVALLVSCPFKSVEALNKLLYSPNVDVSQRILILDVMTDAAHELSDAKDMKVKQKQTGLVTSIASESQPWFLPRSKGPPGAGSWKEVSDVGTMLSWSHRYERELPPKSRQIKMGKSRRWSHRSAKVLENQLEWSKNKFPIYAASFMLPAMQGFDKKRHGVDLLGRDFVVLGKLIYMLGVCMRCTALHPEASALAPALLDLLSSREISQHAESYVRRSVLFAASCILVALHPSYIASALVERNHEISKQLEWIRTWALHIAESDSDTDCSTMAMTCLRLHSEMALQAARAIESSNHFKAKGSLASSVMKGSIIMPYSNIA